MLADYIIPIRINPRHIYDSALPIVPTTHLLRKVYPLSADSPNVLFGDPVVSESDDLSWKVQYGEGVEITSTTLSPRGTEFLVGLGSGGLELRRMEDGSLIRVYATYPGRNEGVGFLSEDGDIVASWGFEGTHADRPRRWGVNQCIVRYTGGINVPIYSKLGLPTYTEFAVAATTDTLALCDINTPHTLLLVDVRTWTEREVTIPPASFERPVNRLYGMFIELAFATDSTSLIDIRASGVIRVWNWRTKDLVASIDVNLSSLDGRKRPLYHFPRSSPHANFAIWQGAPIWKEGVTSGQPALIINGYEAVIIPLAKASDADGAFGNSSNTDSAHPKITYEDDSPLPHYQHIARPSLSDPLDSIVALMDSRLVSVALPKYIHANGNHSHLDRYILSPFADIVMRVQMSRSPSLWAYPTHHPASTTPPDYVEKVITASAISRDGRLLACGYVDGLLQIYDLDSKNQIPQFSSKVGHHGEVHFMAFVLDNTHVATWGLSTDKNSTGQSSRSVELINISANSSTQVELVSHLPSLSPVLSSQSTMAIEWNDQTREREDSFELNLTRFGPKEGYIDRQRLPGSPFYSGWRARPSLAFSPNDRYAGAIFRDEITVWSTATGNAVYSYTISPGASWGVNRGPSVQRYWVSSPLPAPSQITYHAEGEGQYLSQSSPPTLDDAVFVRFSDKYGKDTRQDDYGGAFIPWQSDCFRIVRDGYIRLDNQRRFWVHSRLHSSFYPNVEFGAFGRIHWTASGGSRILLGGRRGLPLLVLELRPKGKRNAFRPH